MNKITLLAKSLTNNYKNKDILTIIYRQCTTYILNNKETKIDVLPTKLKSTSQILVTDLEEDIKKLKLIERDEILEPLSEDISYVGPYVKPTFNFAAYINKSQTLQKLVDLGVNLHKIEKKKTAPEYIMKLDFEKDVKPHILFLNNLGVSLDILSDFITKNPYIFQEDIEDLTVRINYLQYKRFSSEMITRIVSKNPYWLMFSTERIDRKLGHFQSSYNLTGDELRFLATKKPTLITYKMAHVKLNSFCIKEEFGFDDNEIKQLLLDVPKLWMISPESIKNRMDYVLNVMKIPHEQLVKMPKILTSRKFRIQQRHQFLEKIGKAQFNPTKENYVSLHDLVKGTDAEFCANIAKSSIQTYNTFLKSI